jgi:phospholipid-binding lipoprotein MlaA
MTFTGLKRLIVRWSPVMVLALVAACATPPPADDPDAVAEFEQMNDPLEPTNRAVFEFNDWLDVNFLHPTAVRYRRWIPAFIRDRITNLLANLKSPAVLANDLLQGNISRAGSTLGRFVLNTSFGVGGLMDVATPVGIRGHEADFGQTLAVWGVDEGFYLVLPLYGPSNPRDAFGLGAEGYADPLDYYLGHNRMEWVAMSRLVVSGLSKREAYLDTLDDVKRTSLDYYSAMRSLYRQRRDAQIKEAKSGGRADDAAAKER